MASGYQKLSLEWISEADFNIDFNGNNVKTDIVQMPCVLYKKHQKNWTPYEITDD